MRRILSGQSKYSCLQVRGTLAVTCFADNGIHVAGEQFCMFSYSALISPLQGVFCKAWMPKGV